MFITVLILVIGATLGFVVGRHHHNRTVVITFWALIGVMIAVALLLEAFMFAGDVDLSSKEGKKSFFKQIFGREAGQAEKEHYKERLSDW